VESAFRFYDNREKYLLFVTTCGEKSAVADRIGEELAEIRPRRPALHLFDAGMGDGSVLAQVMQGMHKRFRHIPWVIVGKEISLEDVRLSLAKLPDRFCEHPEAVVVVTNMNYTAAPHLVPPEDEAAALLWHEIALEGDTAYDFLHQIRALGEVLGLEIIQRIWPDEQPFRTGRHELLAEAAAQLAPAEEGDLAFIPYDDARALFRYRLHTQPTEVARSIGLSTTLAAWNAAAYVAQISEERVIEAYASGRYLEVTQDVLRRHGGLWFQDETFVIARRAVPNG
jgi:hypothetical protein